MNETSDTNGERQRTDLQCAQQNQNKVSKCEKPRKMEIIIIILELSCCSCDWMNAAGRPTGISFLYNLINIHYQLIIWSRRRCSGASAHTTHIIWCTYAISRVADNEQTARTDTKAGRFHCAAFVASDSANPYTNVQQINIIICTKWAFDVTRTECIYELALDDNALISCRFLFGFFHFGFGSFILILFPCVLAFDMR